MFKRLMFAASLLLACAVCAAEVCPKQPATRHAPSRAPGEYIVRLKGGSAEDPLFATTTFAGCRNKPLDPQTFVANIDCLTRNQGFKDAARTKQAHALASPIEAEIAQIRQYLEGAGKAIDFIEPNYRYHLMDRRPDDPNFPSQWALTTIGAPAAWTRTTGSDDVIVAVVDSGIDLDHPDLAGQLWTHSIMSDNSPGSFDAKLEGIRKIHGANFFPYPPRYPCSLFAGPWLAYPCDAEGHGTAVASIIAARGNNAMGIAGVAWHAQLMAVKFVDGDTDDCSREDCAEIADAVLAIRYAVDSKAQILNLSWGGDTCSLALYSALAYAEQNGVLVVAAAGNEKRDIDIVPLYPASYDLPNIIAVGASDRSDRIWKGSNYGSKVSLFAPGSDMQAADSGGGYADKAGTSMAAPHVSGAAVLVKSLAPEWSYRQIKAYLIDAADQPHNLATGGHLRRRLNVDRATAAPITFDPNLEGSTWTQGDLRTISWSERFQSSACVDGELLLMVEGAVHLQQPSQHVEWRAHQAEITPRLPFLGPRKAKIIARCAGTSITATSGEFTIL